MLPLHDTSSTTFGTDADVAVTVSQQFAVAGRHFTIVREDGHYLLRDLGSGFGTRVNGASVVEQPLVHGDRIQAGKLELVFSDPVVAGAAAVGAVPAQEKTELLTPVQDRAASTEVTAEKKQKLSLGFGRKKKTKLVLPVVKKKPLPKPLIQREVIRIAVQQDPNNPPKTLVSRILGRKRQGSLPELKLSPITEKLDVRKAGPKPAKDKPAKEKRAPKIEPKPILEQAGPEAIQPPEPVRAIPVVSPLPQVAAMTPPAIEPTAAASVVETKVEEPVCAAVEIVPVPVPEVIVAKVVKPAKPKGPSFGEILASKRVAIVGVIGKSSDSVSAMCAAGVATGRGMGESGIVFLRGIGVGVLKGSKAAVQRVVGVIGKSSDSMSAMCAAAAATGRGIGKSGIVFVRGIGVGVLNGSKAAVQLVRSMGRALTWANTAFVRSAKTMFALLVRAIGVTTRSAAGMVQRLSARPAGMKRKAAAVESIAVSATPVIAQAVVGVAAPAPAPIAVAVEVSAPASVPVPVPVAEALAPKPQAAGWGVKLAPQQKVETSPLAALKEWWQAIVVGTAFAALAAVIAWDSQNGKVIYGFLSSSSNSRQPALALNDQLDVQPAVASESRRKDFPVSENKELAGTWVATETIYPSGRKPKSGGVYTGAALRFESWGGLKMLTVPGRKDGQRLSDVEAQGLQVHFQASYEILSPGLVLLHTEDGDVLCSAQRKSDGLALALLAPETREPVVKMYCLPNDQLQ
ncbi:MAG: FHA domain-containing protein [Verrucomicrobia bacterium]|nr:FHA domain-containing protein [Verrucomicrobiota bacterium]